MTTQDTIPATTDTLGHAMTAEQLRTGDVATMTAADRAKARVQDRSDAIKAQQTADRKAAKAAPKANGTGRAHRVPAPKATPAPKAKAAPATTPKAPKQTTAKSKADRVRELLDQGKTVREVANALDDVTWAYAWDVAAAWEKKTGKVVIPSHVKAAAPAPRSRRTTEKATVAK